MHLIFNTPEFDDQLLRALSYIYTQGADLGEVWSMCQRIQDGDFESWYEEWTKLGSRVYYQAEECYGKGHCQSAKECYLRASNYFRTSHFFLYSNPRDPRLIESYDRHIQSFQKALSFFETPPEKLSIPFETKQLEGNLYLQPNIKEPRPLLIAMTGYDGTQQEMYFSTVKPALDRGYHVLTFDGPGQGKAIFKDNITMIPDWEKVLKVVLNAISEQNENRFSHIALLGQSFGGMLAARATAFEPRIDALIVNPGQWDVLETIERFIPNLKDYVKAEDSTVINTYFAAAMKNKMVDARLKSKMWVHGADTPFDLIKIWQDYHLESIVDAIHCPVLVCDCEEEPYSHGQAKEFFNALKCPKEYLLFTSQEGAGEHCASGALSLMSQKAFDWLDEQFKLSSPLVEVHQLVHS